MAAAPGVCCYLFVLVCEIEFLAVIVRIRHTFQLEKGLLGQRPHIPVHTRHGCGDLAYRPASVCVVVHNFKLSYEKKREILQNNIWGVDIDILAVEVAKFSLLIKLIEDSSLYEMESFVKNNNCRILPSLDNNIKNGNSLVDEKYIEFKKF